MVKRKETYLNILNLLQ